MTDPIWAVPRLGLIDDISAGTYPTFLSQIREAVSNALDAGATECNITYNSGNTKSVQIFDNGEGLSDTELQEELLAVGGSSKKKIKDNIGNIGIGFYALTSSCKTLEIITQKKTTAAPIHALINCEFIHHQDEHKRDMAKTPIGHWLTKNVVAASASSQKSYTIMRLINPNSDVLSIFADSKNLEELKRELRMSLPLSYDYGSPIFVRHPQLISLYKKLNLKTIKVSVNGDVLNRLMYGDEKDQEFNGKFDLIDSWVNKLHFVGFSYVAPEKQITPIDVHGFQIRLNNVGIGKPRFLGFSGQGIDARGKRLTGEIHLAEFPKRVVLIGREGFRANNPQYKELQKFVHDQIRNNLGLVNEIYGAPKQAKEVVDAPAKIQSAMQKSVDVVKHEKTMNSSLSEKSVITLSAAPDLTLTDYEKIINFPVVYQVRDPSKKKKSFSIEISNGKKREPRVVIYNRKFYEKIIEVKIKGKTYNVVFKKTGDKDTPIEIDYLGLKVYVNKSSHFFRHDGAFLDPKKIVLAFWIKYLFDHSSNKKDYYEKLMVMLPKLLLKK